MKPHKKPITRRDFMAAGLIQGAGYVMLPTALELLLNTAVAQAQSSGCLAPSANTMPAFITIDAVGGACFAWDLPPLDQNGNLLSSYSKLGLGNLATTTAGLVAAPFGNTVKINRSGPGTLIPQIITSLGANATAILGQTVCMPIWSTSMDDSRTVGNGLQTAVINAGLVGTVKLLGTSSTATGVSNVDAFNLASVTPFVPGSVDDLVNSLGTPTTGAFGLLSSAKKNAVMRIISSINTNEANRYAAANSGTLASSLIGCSQTQNITTINGPPKGDPRTSPIASIWGLTAATPTNSTNAIQAAMVYATLAGNAGPAGIEMSGYDYHGQGQTVQNTQHQALGTLIANILASAQVLKRDTFIWLCTDGATASSDSTSPSAPQGDSGTNGGNVCFMYKASGAPPATNAAQIGYFNTSSQQNDPASPSENIQLGAASAFLHYLAFAGGQAQVNNFASLVPGVTLTTQQITQLLALVVS